MFMFLCYLIIFIRVFATIRWRIKLFISDTRRKLTRGGCGRSQFTHETLKPKASQPLIHGARLSWKARTVPSPLQRDASSSPAITEAPHMKILRRCIVIRRRVGLIVGQTATRLSSLIESIAGRCVSMPKTTNNDVIHPRVDAMVSAIEP